MSLSIFTIRSEACAATGFGRPEADLRNKSLVSVLPYRDISV
jgi:hypothetical protein